MKTLSVVALSALAAPAIAGHDFIHHNARRHPLVPREYVTPSTLAPSYDYIIAGGGLAGLVLASKLSSDGKTTVLVLEAGQDGVAQKATIDRPGLTYFTSMLGGEHDWLYSTVPQPNAGDRSIRWPRGKILGGSSTVNGMYMVRPNSKEVDAMHDLIADGDNKAYADAWTWSSLLESMKSAETFTPPTAAASEVAGMRYDSSSHGTSGPLQVTYPAYMVPISNAWLPSLEAAGVRISDDAYNGDNLGGFFSMSAINPSNWTRSYAKSAYIDPLPPRSNLHILTSSYVTKITFSDEKVGGDVVATGVEFAANRDAAPTAVKADKEVILAGGAVGSPHMLMVSGVGPEDMLNELNIPVQVALPGVGQHMQDHLATGVTFNTEAETQGTIYASGSDFSKSDEFLSFINSGTSYINGTLLFEGEENYKSFVDGIAEIFNDDSITDGLIPSTDPTVKAGYKAIYKALLDKVYPESGLIEVLYSINAPGRIIIQTAIQTPLSQGRMYINSPSIFDNPLLDPNYFSHGADAVIMRQAIKLARRIASQGPLADILGEEVSPGPDVQSDADIENFVKNSAGTEFHPGCTCAMLPLEQGGVVDASLKVYGTTNVRVIDGSVFALSMSAHLMAPIYGLAEKAADLILNPPTAAGNSGTKTSTGKGSSSTSKAGSSDDTAEADDDGAAAGLSSSAALMFTVFGFMAMLFAL